MKSYYPNFLLHSMLGNEEKKYAKIVKTSLVIKCPQKMRNPELK